MCIDQAGEEEALVFASVIVYFEDAGVRWFPSQAGKVVILEGEVERGLDGFDPAGGAGYEDDGVVQCR